MLTMFIPRWIIFMLDILLVSAAYLLVIATYQLVLHSPSPAGVELRILFAVGIYVVFELITRVYRGTVRYSGLNEMVRLFSMTTIATLSIIACSILLEYLGYITRISPIWVILHGGISFIFMFMLRIAVKYSFYYLTTINKEHQRVIIYGSDTHAVALTQQFAMDSESRFKPVAMIDSSGTLGGVRVGNVPVVVVPQSVEEIQELMYELRAEKILIAEELIKQMDREVIDLLIQAKVKLFVVGGTSDIRKRGEKKSKLSVHEIQIEDLLDREIIKTDNVVVAEKHVGRVVLVSGAAGSIGSEIAYQVAKYSPELLVILDQAESPLHDLELRLLREFPTLNLMTYIGDVSNKGRMEMAFDRFRPEIIYHAAAYKHVPMMERYPCEAVRVNVLGTKTMADLAVQYNARKFIMVSTDKAVNPTNVMGATKRIAEIYVQSLYLSLEHLNAEHRRRIRFITTRFGNVLGSNGSVVPLFKDQIAKGGPITLTHRDIIRYFMTIPEACRLVLEAGCMGRGGEIFVFDMGSPVKIYDLATRMIRLAGLTPGEDIEILETGLRPGEKLYEELLNDQETTLPTHHEKIMVAKVREYDFAQVTADVQAMVDTALINDQMETVRRMKALVPEFKSKNSLYESLDV